VKISLVAAIHLLVATFMGSCRDSDFYSMADFDRVRKIDSHVHIETNDSSAILQAKADNFQLLTINYDDVNEGPPIEQQQQFALKHLAQFPEALNFITGVSIRTFNSPNWTEQTTDFIADAVLRGARAVKIYKIIGMSLRDQQGKLVMVDDRRLDSLFNFIDSMKLPVVGHLGEPRNCWLPVDKMTVKGDQSYFTEHPEYHMFRHPDLPSYEDQIRARDNRLARNPQMVFVGAHLGSLEWNVDSLAARLDRFPNMAVDMAARIVHLQVQSRDNWQKVHDFMMKYSDRLLYATDLSASEKSLPGEVMKSFDQVWRDDWKYFATSDEMRSDQFEGKFKGLHLPKDVIDKIYHGNARKWLKIF